MVTPLMGVISSMISLGMSVGIVGGAAALESVEWHIMFWITLPIIFCFTAGFIVVMPGIPSWVKKIPKLCNIWPGEDEKPEEQQDHAKTKTSLKKKLLHTDIIGALLLAAGVVLLLMSFTFSETWGWKDAGTICMVVIGPLLLVALIVLEFFVPKPLIPIRSLLNRNQLVLCFISIFSGLAQFALFQILPYLYTAPMMEFQVPADNMLKVGLYLLPYGLATLAAMPFAIGVGMFLGYPVATITSNAIAVLGIGLMIKYHHTPAQTVVLNCVAGFGLGLSTISLMNLLMLISKPSEFGALSGANLLLRFVGGSLGPVVVSLVVSNTRVPLEVSGVTYQLYTEDSFVHAFTFLTVVMGVALLGSCVLSNIFKFVTKEGRKEIRQLAKMSGSAGH